MGFLQSSESLCRGGGFYIIVEDTLSQWLLLDLSSGLLSRLHPCVGVVKWGVERSHLTPSRSINDPLSLDQLWMAGGTEVSIRGCWHTTITTTTTTIILLQLCYHWCWCTIPLPWIHLLMLHSYIQLCTTYHSTVCERLNIYISITMSARFIMLPQWASKYLVVENNGVAVMAKAWLLYICTVYVYT